MTFSSANRRWILRAGVSVLAVAGFFLLFAGNPPGTAASQAEVPGVPSNIQVQLGHSGELVASWRAPASDGGSAITGYKVQWKEAADSWDTPTSVSETMVTGTSHTISGLTDGTEYTVRIIAVNGIGDGPPSSEETCPGGYDPEPTPVEVEAVPIVVESTTEEYFVLYVKHDLDGTEVELPVSVTLGQDGTTTLAENVEALPAERYRVEKYLIADPADVDGDCVDDITELGDWGNMNPVNPAAAIALTNGAVAIPDRDTFETLSSGKKYMKFLVFGMNTDRPSIYFINTGNHVSHNSFVIAVGLEWGRDTIRGQLYYNSQLAAPGGSTGAYYYHGPGGNYPFSVETRFFTMLAANMPLIKDNLSLYMPNNFLPRYQSELPLYRESRIPLLFTQDIYPEKNFEALNLGEGYGRLRVMELDERPNPRDVVLYEALRNELPRVAGIITTVPQTPLSHVNLRAVQDGVPNSFIRDALDNTDIDDLVDSHVHYTVTEDGWTLRAATPAEVDAHYASSRPATEQTPQRDLSVTSITPLSQTGFEDWTAFGVKAANVAVLGTLGFPEGTVPAGFAVPFYFYDEFMKHNELYDDIEDMLADPDFQTDFDVQEEELKDLRKAIKKGETPEWIIEALTEMHATYPDGQSLRYRSSTNNEDLPGFNGAGLYDSKTQHPEETEEDGIAKSLKQVYASLWNFLAFTERDFHRIDHLAAAMGVLVHPNYSDELANGVAVSFDPVYGQDDYYYANTQLGEDLVTNPDAHSMPEEILLDKYSYWILATSNQVEPGQLLMSDDQMSQLRQHLEVIHEEFAELYNPAPDDPFAMEIEFKITSEDILAIKQARPWVFSQTPADVASDTNTPAIGQPTISGTAHVGETLTAETAAINDDDGLSNVVYSYQWLADDTEIAGATDPTYTLVDADAGLTIKVKVSFFDDKNNPETLTSAATTAVLANVPDAPEHLNVSLHDTGALDVSWEAPARDGGSAVTGYRVQWKETAGNWDIPADVSEETVTGTTHTITGLTDGVEYAVRIIAANDVGEGPPSDEATGTPRETTPPELSTATVDGATLTLTYDEDLDENSEPSSDAFSVTVGGTGRAVDGVSVSGSSVILTLGSAVASGATVTVSYAAPADTAAPRIQDEAGNPAASFSDQDVENNTPPPANTPATGAPIISGMAQVGETLTVDTSGIDDADGIGNATFSYQWIAGTTDISGATGSSYAPLVADLGKTIKVRVSFMDGASNVETLTSEATATVVTPLTAEFQDAPDKHLGTGFFTFDIAFSEPISISYKTLRDDSLEVTNGSATKAKRVDGQSDLWKITVEPDSDADVTVVLPITEDCAAQDAVCTRDGTKLSNRSELTVPGPAAANSPATGAPIISGTAEVGETLTVDTSGIDDADGMSGAVFSYQWLANDAEITGATGDTYTLVEADVGKAVKVRVIFNDDDDNEETLTSEATASVAPRPNTPATGAPTIIGTAQVGETLTVDTSGIDDADGLDNATFSYQWIAGTTDIAGATDPTYTLVADDVGKAIKVRVSFDDDRNNQETLTSEATATVVTPLTAEFRDAPDKHLGTGVFTFLIALSEPISISYKTLRDGSLEVTNGSATKAKRVDGQSDLWEITIEPDSNADVTVVLPVTEDCESDGAVCTRDGMGLSNRSELTVPGPAAANSPATGAPIISGTARVGETLTVDTSGIDDADGMSGAVFSYQWLADGVDIAGATSDTYTPVADDVGKAIKVKVSFRDDKNNPETLTSAATAAVEPRPNSPATGAPTISGTVRVGETLTAGTSAIADADGMSGAVFIYQWLAKGADVAGATSDTYTLVDTDVGKTIKVKVSFRDDRNHQESLTSAATAAATAAADESAVWSATLTVGSSGSFHGYWNDLMGSLAPDGFNIDGSDYTVTSLSRYGDLMFAFVLDQALPGDFTLQVGDTTLRSEEAEVNTSSSSYSYQWQNKIPDLSDGDIVEVSLTLAE